MKKLLLTSAGLEQGMIRDFFVKQFDRVDNKKACLITSARTAEEDAYIEASKREFVNLGISVEVVNVSQDINVSNLPEYDIYYSCGGNTFYILDRMRKTGMDKVLIQAITDGKLYIGVSAGSMLVGPDISLSDAYGDDESDANDVGLQDLSGFGSVPCFIMPHYIEQYEQVAREFQKKIPQDQSVFGLTDAQALFVTDNETLLIGEQGGLLLGDISRIQNKTR